MAPLAASSTVSAPRILIAETDAALTMLWLPLMRISEPVNASPASTWLSCTVTVESMNTLRPAVTVNAPVALTFSAVVCATLIVVTTGVRPRVIDTVSPAAALPSAVMALLVESVSVEAVTAVILNGVSLGVLLNVEPDSESNWPT